MKKFGDNSKSYPADMRRQLWPLCCGASILSGLKHTGSMSVDAIAAEIETTIKDYVPDHQVFAGETLCPKLTFVTINESQSKQQNIRDALTKTGFVLFAVGRPRGSLQHFFVRDDSKTFELVQAA